MHRWPASGPSAEYFRPISPVRSRVAALVLGGLALFSTGCAGGPRPVLVDNAVTVESVSINGPDAPAGTSPLGGSSSNIRHPTAEDALYAWALDAPFVYGGDCLTNQMPPVDTLCGVSQGISDVWVIGRGEFEPWYVAEVTLEGGGWRVDQVRIAGT